jgi:hypothetical protein
MAIRAPRPAQLGEAGLERAVLRRELVLGDLDDHVGEVARQARAHERRGQRRRRAVQRQVRAVRAVGRAQRGGQGDGLELRAEAAAGRLVEEGVGRAAVLAREARERLVADQAARGELDDRLEDRLDRVGLLEQGLDLQARGALGRQRLDLVGVVALGARAALALGDAQGGAGEVDEVGLGAALLGKADVAGRRGQLELGRR